jgi:hypothetical protein
LKKAFIETYKVSQTFSAPIEYVFDWCTDFREDDGQMIGSKTKKSFIERTDKRIVWAVERKEKGKKVVGIRVVWLDRPNSWTLNTCGDQIEVGHYVLKKKGKNKTKLDMEFNITFDSKDEVEDKKKWLKSSKEEWGTFRQHLEEDYKAGKPAVG